MISYPDPQQVLDGLGDKVVHGLGAAVSHARADLDEYRALRPEWVVRQGPRGLANWIQDMLWHHVSVEFDAMESVTLVEQGVTREAVVGGFFRLRLKRHHLLGEVSTFPTPTALAFLKQPEGQFPGMESVHLIAGYEWDSDERQILRPVLSLRDGQDDLQWLVELPETQEGAPVIFGPSDEGHRPTPPEINVVTDGAQKLGGVEEKT